MQPKAMSHPLAPNFHASHWKQREAWQNTWHALDTAFGCGESFLHTLQAWRADAVAPDRLFFTAFSADSPKQLEPFLAKPCYGLLPGVHRISFEKGRVQLTLCIGPTPLLAKEIDTPADSICVDSLVHWGAKPIARMCKTGTHIKWNQASSETLADIQTQGVVLDKPTHTARYMPQWDDKSSLRGRPSQSSNALQNEKKVIVIGAGLAGSAVAHSLAQRGFSVLVLDQGSHLGAGASGLPAGIFATYVSPDNGALARITRDGVRATVQRASDLLQKGLEWNLTPLLEHRYAGKRQLPAGSLWPAAGLAWSTDASLAQKQQAGLNDSNLALWHPMAGWIQTQALVKAQLTMKNIQFLPNAVATKLVRINSQWHVLDAQGNTLAQSTLVVLANAHPCQTLLDSVETNASEFARPRLPATALRGQVMLGPMSLLSQNLQNKLPEFPVNGHGSFIGMLTPLPCQNSALALNEPYWIVGSSFQRNDFNTQYRNADQISNHQQWAELMPAWYDDILKGLDSHQAQAWVGVRSALPDRLPAVGSFHHPEFEGLSVCTGMGARGISWSVLCGELLAAHMLGEPLPMAASLAKLMAASRFG